MTIGASTPFLKSRALRGSGSNLNNLRSAPAPIGSPQDQHSLSIKPGRNDGHEMGPLLFGPFHLLPKQRLLLEAGKPVCLGSRAFELLVALLERPGELITKNELLARVWAHTHVVEGNLKFQVAALRRALRDGTDGHRYVVTAPGLGYRFVAPVRLVGDQPLSQVLPQQQICHSLPVRSGPLFGRAQIVDKLVRQLPLNRLLTIVGAGGVGKTSVALAVAERLIHEQHYDAYLVDVAALADPTHLPIALANALGLPARSEDPTPASIALLKKKPALLILDNCAHGIEAAAALAGNLVQEVSGLHILATSREPLRVQGEHIHRLLPLPVPAVSAAVGVTEALRCPAVQLFVDRASASLDNFGLTDTEVPIALDICRKLDGIPLAIELAASNLSTLGLVGLGYCLRDPLGILTRGCRTAPARHQSMRATLDWSYGVLDEIGQRVLRRLSIFAGDFTLRAAAAVLCDLNLVEEEITEQVLSLAAKSLILVDTCGNEPRYRLFETTRAYAFGKLSESGEVEEIRGRRVECGVPLEAIWRRTSRGRYEPEVDKVRTAHF